MTLRNFMHVSDTRIHALSSGTQMLFWRCAVKNIKIKLVNNSSHHLLFPLFFSFGSMRFLIWLLHAFNCCFWNQTTLKEFVILLSNATSLTRSQNCEKDLKGSMRKSQHLNCSPLEIQQSCLSNQIVNELFNSHI